MAVNTVISISVLLISAISIFPILLIRRIIAGKRVFYAESIIGHKGRKTTVYYFNLKNYILRNIPLFFFVLTNKLSIVGISIKEYCNQNRVIGDNYLYANKPGIFNLWYVRQSAKVTHEGHFGTEWEYTYKKSLITDFLIILKSIPAAFYYIESSMCKSVVNIFDLNFDNLTMEDAISKLLNSITTKNKKKVYFVNPDCLNKIFEDKSYFEVLRNGDYVFPDGIGVNIACKILRNPLKANINGTDMLPFICEMVNDNKSSIFLLGGKPGVAEKMKENLESKYSGLKISGIQDGYFNRETESQKVIEHINSSGADVLLVAFGAPLQEKWISENCDKLNPYVQMGVGGLFDFYSSNVKRAPKWMREVGLEWVFRMIQEPKRLWRRYIIGNPVFLYRVLRWKFTRKQN